MHVELRLVMAVIGLAAALLSYRLLSVLNTQGDELLAAVHFDDAATVRDFLALAAGSFLLFFGFIAVIAGVRIGDHLLREIGQTLIVTYFLIPMMLLWRWERRFQ